MMTDERPTEIPVPRWLHFVMVSDKAGSSWYLGASLLFAPALALLSPWPTASAVLWWIIGLTGFFLGVLGIAMTAGLAQLLRAGTEIPENYWRFMLDHRRTRCRRAEPPIRSD